MKKFIIVSILFAMTGCAANPDQKPIDTKMVIGTVALIAVAGAIGASQHKSKCDNNRAGFYVDNVNHKVYTC